MVTRRNFIKTTAIAGVAVMSGVESCAFTGGKMSFKNITIQSVGSESPLSVLLDSKGAI
jgi:hypothetical protein